MAKRQPIDFSYQKPDNKAITDPVGDDAIKAGAPVSTEYPKHLHKFAGDGNPFEFVEVKNEDEEADERANGFKSVHEVNADQRKAKKAAPESESKPKETAAAPKAKRGPKAKKVAPVESDGAKAEGE